MEILNNLPSLSSDLTQKYFLSKSHRFYSRSLASHKSYQTVITSVKSAGDCCSIVLYCIGFFLLGNRRIIWQLYFKKRNTTHLEVSS
ncbi:hypothetical protein ACRRTK_002802 [Alexandromys fortis]